MQQKDTNGAAKTAPTNEAQRWSDLVTDYEALAEPLTRQYALEALRMVGGVGSGMRVLDVAAGTGALSLPAAEAGADVLATDLSPGMVARLSERLAAYPNCRAEVMDGQALDTPDGAFDAAFSLFGIIAFPDWRQGLRELARSTRKNGQGCVAVWRDPRGTGPVLLLAEAVESALPGSESPLSLDGMRVLSSPQALEAEMTAAGFGAVQVQAAEALWVGPSVEEFMADTERQFWFLPFYAKLDQSDRARLQPALREVAERHAVTGLIHMTGTALIAAGRKG